MIQGTLAVWSLVPLPFLNPAWTSGSSWFTYCWSLAWRFLSITLLTCESESHSVMSDSLWLHGLYSLWNSPGQNTGVGCHFLFQGIFPTQGSNLGLSHCRQTLYSLSHQYMQNFVYALQDWSLCFPQSSGRPIIKSCWPSRPDSMGITSPLSDP